MSNNSRPDQRPVRQVSAVGQLLLGQGVPTTARVSFTPAPAKAPEMVDGEPLVVGYQSCGSCTLCCKLPPIQSEQMTKPANTWCKHCKPGKGCGIYENKPDPCNEFQCLWTHLHSTGAPLPDRFRPDRVKAYLLPSTDGKDLHVVADPAMPGAWRNGEFGAVIRGIAAGGKMKVLVQEGTKFIRLVPTPEGLQEVRGVGIVSEDGKTTDVIIQK